MPAEIQARYGCITDLVEAWSEEDTRGRGRGRDNDSIAGMGGAIAGAMHGIGAVREDRVSMINSANDINLMPLADDMAGLARALQARQLENAQARNAAFAKMG